jgi:aspartate/glutamate racemase
MTHRNLVSLRSTQKKIGVLGGIGADASAYFYKKLIDGYRQRRQITSNTQYPQILINSVPLPELHLDEHDTPEIINQYASAVAEISKCEPDFLVMVCNTIHLYLEEMAHASNGVPILNLPRIVNDKIASEKNHTFCILGTGLTISKSLYGGSLKTIPVRRAEYELLCQAVVDYNNGGSVGNRLAINKEIVKGVIAKKLKAGATKFIYACTEISEIMLDEEDVLSLDTMEILIESTLDALTGSLSEIYFLRSTVRSSERLGSAEPTATSIL